MSGSRPGPADALVPESDAAGLTAFLRLLARVFGEGGADEAAAWMRLLEEEAGVAPLWEPLFQLMCHPVPQVRGAGFFP